MDDDEKKGLMTNEQNSSPDPDAGKKEKHCFPYYDFTVEVLEKFDGSFVLLLAVLNFNFGLWVLIGLAS
jgi:hypothetical protein